CEPLGFQTLAVLRECGLGDLLLAHGRLGAYLAECLPRFPFGAADLLRRFIAARCLHFPAFGRSTRASLNSSGPFSNRLFRLARSPALAALSAKLSITVAANSLARVAFTRVGLALAISPNSTKRQIASERLTSLA